MASYRLVRGNYPSPSPQATTGSRCTTIRQQWMPMPSPAASTSSALIMSSLRRIIPMGGTKGSTSWSRGDGLWTRHKLTQRRARKSMRRTRKHFYISHKHECSTRKDTAQAVAQRSFTIPRVAQESPQVTTDGCRQESAVAQSALSVAWLSVSNTLHRGVPYRLQSADPPG